MELREKIASLFAVARRAGAENKPGDPDDFAALVLAIPELDPTPTKQRILIALGGLRDNMTPQQVRTVQWFADQLPNA